MSTSLRYLGFVLCALIVLSPLALHASPVLRSGDEISVSESQAVDGDFYAAAGTITVSGPVEGDLHAAGGTVTVQGAIEDDVVVAGGTVAIHGTVGDDVRVAGGEVTLAGTVRGDVLVAGGIVRILSTAVITGDLLFLSGETEVAGEVRGSLLGHAEALRINGPVGGDVSVSVARAFSLGDQANIEGSIEYASAGELVRAPGSVVVGDIEKRAWNPGATSEVSVVPALALFFASLAYLLVARTRLTALMRRAVDSYGVNGLVGLGVLLGAPLVAILLLVTVIALPIGLALTFLYALGLALAWSLMGVFAGAALSRYFEGTVVLSVKWVLLGALVATTALYLPYLGGLVVFLTMLVLLGALATALYSWVRG